MLKSISFRIQLIFLSVLIILGVLVLLSFSDSSQVTDSIYEQNGLIFSQTTDEPFTGKVVDTVASRIVKYDVKDGIKNGEFIICLLDGTESVIGEMINNKNEGKWSYYYPNGKLESVGYFKSDLAVDKWTWYYSNGNKMEEGKFINGKREGNWLLYNKDGTLKSSVVFKDGTIITTTNLKSLVAT